MSKFGLKRLDIYIIKKFLGTFVFSIILILSIAIVFDIAEQIDDFMESDATFWQIVTGYYLNFIPYFANLFTPLFVFIAVIFFTSKMAQKTEIIAILSSGISFRRFLFPYFISSLIIAIFSLFMSNYFIPNANKGLFAFKKAYIWNKTSNTERNIHKQLEPGMLLYMESYSTEFDIGYRFTLEKIRNDSLVSKLMSDMIQWDSTKGKWTIKSYYIRNIYPDHEDIIKGNDLDTTLQIKPSDFKERMELLEAMNYFELSEYIKEQEIRGSPNIEKYRIQQYLRVSNPFSIFILALIGICVSSRKVRGGTGMHIGLGLALSFSYILILQMSTNFAISGSLPAIVGVWLPNIVYTIIGIFLYRLTPK
ncbi:MAG: hypothetical protein CVU05_13695 [Bacteroidetes bacterium HGW-Bacteroidetes-21]|jgi:lipopolysaccharide export system permease protein|nr:MAG: hypothetical protein CVU05_13695 [Bacteroidetes bacterium HGW-Bacteroidetes-21]